MVLIFLRFISLISACASETHFVMWIFFGFLCREAQSICLRRLPLFPTKNKLGKVVRKNACFFIVGTICLAAPGVAKVSNMVKTFQEILRKKC